MKFLEFSNMLGNFESIQDINFDLIPNEPDLLSLELNFAFRDLYLNGNMLYYNYVATSLLRLESIYGEFQNIYAKGDGAKYVYDIYVQEHQLQQE